MSKVFSWFFGSFFRTLGRVLTYILIGYLISILLSNNNINIIDYLIPKVNADSGDSFNDIVSDIDLYIDDKLSKSNERVFTNAGNVVFTLKSDDIWNYYNGENPNYAYITVCQAIRHDITAFSSGNWSTDVNVINTAVPCQFYGTDAYPDARLVHITFKLNTTPNTTGSGSMCHAGASSIYCDVDNSITVNQSGTNEWTLQSFGFSKEPFQFDNSTSALINQNDTIIKQNDKVISQNGIIIDQNTITNNKLDGVNDSINKVEDTITNDAIDDNKINEFIENSKKEDSSLTPFSDFVNLPLKWVQSLLASGQSCETINLPLPFTTKTLTLMCMTEFWEKMGVLGVLIQTVWVAVVGVRIFNGLFLLTCETLDPNPDKDMSKLRTWEL